MKLKAITAVVLAATAFGASAANQSFSIVAGTGFNFNGLNTLLSSADQSDTITFGGLAAGNYTALLSFSSVNVHITSASLNGVLSTNIYPNMYNSIGFFSLAANSPFELKLFGTVTGDPIGATYNGQIVVTSVPEPATYGMLLGGLGMLGFIARRRKQS
jgi:hypothetical protein